MDENKKDTANETTPEKKTEFDFVVEDPYAGKVATEGYHSHHSHHSSHHSSHHHGRHKSKKHSTHKKAKRKLKEPSIRFLTVWLVGLTLACLLLAAWNIELNSSVKVNSDKIKALINSEAFSGLNAGNAETEKDENIPSYVENEAQRVIEQVSALQSENTVSFISVSDMHLKSDDERVVEGLRHAGQAMKLIREGVDIDFAINLGDITWGSSETPLQTGINEIKMANDFIEDGFADIPNFRVAGNHDLLMYSYDKNLDFLDDAELYDLIGSYNEGAVLPEGYEQKGYFYRDLEDLKLRVICLNLNEYKEGITPEEFIECYISPAQVKWFADTLDLSSKTDSNDWKVVILSHQPLYWFQAYASMIDIVDAYTFGTSGSVMVDGEEIFYDYQGKNAAQVIANIHGHLHNLRTDTIGAARIPAITIPNACFLRNNEYGTAASYSEEIHNKYGEKTTYGKTENSSEDTAFSVVTIDLEYGRIYVTNYGAGYDREVSY